MSKRENPRESSPTTSKKLKPSSSDDSNEQCNTIPTLDNLVNFNHDALKQLFSTVDTLHEQLEFIPSVKDDPEFDPLGGSDLINAFKTYKWEIEGGKSKTKARQAMVEELMENKNITLIKVAELITNWLIETYTDLFTIYIARKELYLLVSKEALYFEYLSDENIVNTVSEVFSLLLSATNKQQVEIPFMACAPGYGKSRTLQEIFSKTKQGIEFKENSIELLISFGNTTPLLISESNFEHALCGRILYSYLDIPSSYGTFFQEIWKYEKSYTFEKVIQCIARHWRKSKPSCRSDDDLYIYLGIDEFTNLADFKYFNTDNKEITFLDGVINIIGNTIINPKEGVKLLPFFAGLDYKIFTTSIAKSSFGCHSITPYKFTERDEQLIVKQYFPSLLYDQHLWKVINFCNRHPRLLVWLIIKFNQTNNLKLAYKGMSLLYNTAYRTMDIPIEVAKWILAHVITQKDVSDNEDLSIVQVGDRVWTIRQLKENGWISINESHLTAPFPLLQECCCKLDNTDGQLFLSFFKHLENDSWEHHNNEKNFQFYTIFDCVLNRCFIYLGFSTMEIKERFRGAKFGKDTKIDRFIKLESCPNKYIVKTDVNSENHSIPPNTMIVNEISECSFDRLMTVKIVAPEQHEPEQTLTILWQDRKETLSDMENFQNLENMAQKENTLSIIITTNSETMKKNFGIIDWDGLKEYYGSYVHKLITLSYSNSN